MKNFKNIIVVILAMIAFCSCEPRIDLDEGQWGNNSEMLNVVLFVYEFEDHELQEFRETGELTPGVRKVLRSTGLNIDVETQTASVNLPASYSLVDDVIAIAFQHSGTKVEPLDGAPVAGLPADLTNGPYTYRVHSADGSFTDWTITINQL